MQLMVNYIEKTSCNGGQGVGTPSATAGGCTRLQASSGQPQVLLWGEELQEASVAERAGALRARGGRRYQYQSTGGGQ